MMGIDIFQDSIALAVQLQLLLLMQDAAADAADAAAAVVYVSQSPSGQSHMRDDLPSLVASKLTCIDVG